MLSKDGHEREHIDEALRCLEHSPDDVEIRLADNVTAVKRTTVSGKPDIDGEIMSDTVR